MNEHEYVGGELELFAQANHWKRYWISRLRRYLGGSVLEVGAGIGTNTLLLRTGSEQRWVCLEPDPRLAAELTARIATAPACRNSEVHVGTLTSLASDQLFDCILYIDVLEHIEDDHAELREASRHLNPGGHLIVLSPAHAWLFSPFDQAIGHWRRYTADGLAATAPTDLRLAKSFYLDSVGLLASAANRVLLRQSLPNARQIGLWDGLMVPCSRVLDPITGYRLGKSVVCVWERCPVTGAGPVTPALPPSEGEMVTERKARSKSGERSP